MPPCRAAAAGALGVALTVSGAWAREAIADEPPATPSPTEDSRDVVLVAVAATDEESSDLADALRELVARLGFQLQVSRAEAPPWALGARPPAVEHARAQVWIDARPADRVEILVSAARGAAFDAPVARLVQRGDAPAIVVERVAHVIHATLESLLAQPEPGSPAASSPPPPDPQASQPDRDQSAHGHGLGLGLDAAVFGACHAVASSSGPVFGGGAALELVARRLPLRPSLWLAATLHESFDTAGQDMDLETNISSFRFVPGLELWQVPALSVDVGAGAGLDLFHTIPRDASGSSVELGGATTQVDPVVEAQVVSRIRIGGSARLLVGLELDYDFGLHRYVAVDRFDNPAPVLEPWAWRPSAILGLCLPLAGATACASSE